QPAARAAVDAGVPGQAGEPVKSSDLSNVRFAVEAIQLAANNDQLGADVSQVDDILRSHLGLDEGKGLVVRSVADDGPAAKAGIQKNDVLVTAAEQEITGLDAFRKMLETSPDRPLAIGLIRAGKKQSVEVTPRAATRVEIAIDRDNGLAAEPKYWLGLGLASADDTLRSQLSVPAEEGLVVTSIEEGSPAAQAGVMVNDVLLQLDGKGLTTIEALSEQLQSIADKSAPLKLLRRGKPAMLTVTATLHAPAVNAVAQLVNPYDNVVFFNTTSFPQWIDLQAVPNAYTNSLQAVPSGYTNTNPYNWTLNTLYAYPAWTDVATQLSALEAQVKQLEATLAALRTSLGTPAQPAQGGEEKK
ncbi:MAG TPA: PDZ domain-containing protein, partial [Pirellulales bacterium]|nr:PDZ domain-containing protein [Pirellulales bacterium]